MSLKDSKDAIEQLWGNEILKYFPNYEAFWRAFIGNPYAEYIEPYKYVFPSNMSLKEKDRIQNLFEKIQIIHYSLFCHLAGAHFQQKELENTMNIKNPRKRYFRHWEHFEVGYLHLGSVFYLLEGLWNIFLKMKGVPHERFGENCLRSQGKNDLANRLKEAHENVKIRRDLGVHRGRVFALLHMDKFYVPLKVNKDMMWSNSANTTEWIETTVKLSEDIIETEKLINDLHEALISEYEDFIAEKKIQIDYGENK